MPSLADIPNNLLHLDRKDEFLRWLRDLQTDNMTKKELLFLWADSLGYTVTIDDLVFVFGEDYKERGI